MNEKTSPTGITFFSHTELTDQAFRLQTELDQEVTESIIVQSIAVLGELEERVHYLYKTSASRKRSPKLIELSNLERTIAQQLVNLRDVSLQDELVHSLNIAHAKGEKDEERILFSSSGGSFSANLPFYRLFTGSNYEAVRDAILNQQPLSPLLRQPPSQE